MKAVVSIPFPVPLMQSVVPFIALSNRFAAAGCFFASVAQDFAGVATVRASSKFGQQKSPRLGRLSYEVPCFAGNSTCRKKYLTFMRTARGILLSWAFSSPKPLVRHTHLAARE